MSIPDPKRVREIARTAVGYAIRDQLVQAAMAEHDISADNVYAWSETYDAVLDAIAAGAQEPDEQAPNDGDAEYAAGLEPRTEQGMCSCNEPRVVCELRTELDKREVRIAALEAENGRMREELEQACKLIDELTAAPAPELSTCQDIAMSAKALEQIATAVQKQVTTEAAPQQPAPFADECDCECQPGQPCLCPERDCYCGPCRVCGENPQQLARDIDLDEHRPFTMADYRDQLGGTQRRPRIGEEQR